MTSISKRRWILGPAVILVGLWLLLDARDIVDLSAIAVVPPAVVICYGLAKLAAGRLRRIFWPWVIVLIGIAWLAAGAGVASIGEIIGTYWPVVIVLAGLSMVVRRR